MKHPFEPFIPNKCHWLIVGSAPPNESPKTGKIEWYYGSQKNKFWKLIEEIYTLPENSLKSRKEQESLLRSLNIGIVDIAKEYTRKEGNSSDKALQISECLDIPSLINSKVTICVTSRFVENRFKKEFKHKINFEKIKYLPSPSNRNARHNKSHKLTEYRKNLPTFS